MNSQIDITKFKSFNSFKTRFISFFPENAFKDESKDHCWIWQGPKRNPKRKFTYGTISWGKGSHYLAHRLSYLIFIGAIPGKLLVRHTCNNSLCVNPAHLVLGSHKDNMQDMIDSGNAIKNVLNEEAVKVIKWFLKYESNRGLSTKLAKIYNVNKTTISEIKNNHQWAWIKV